MPPQLREHDPNTCDCCMAPVNPPITLPSAVELATAARESAEVQDLLACVRWVGAGRAVSKRAVPSVADTRALGAELGVDLPDSVREPRCSS
jgi:hypothetical protein